MVKTTQPSPFRVPSFMNKVVADQAGENHTRTNANSAFKDAKDQLKQ